MTKRGVIMSVVTAVGLLAVVVSSTFWVLRQTLPEAEGLGRASEWKDEGASASPAPASREAGGAAEGRIRVTLYFLSASGETLAAEEREIPLATSIQDQARQVVRQLLSGSRTGHGSAFPSGVVLRNLFITPEGLAFVDLSQELVSNHPGGTCAEELTVYSLANTLVANFPAVKRVQILVEGREVESLAGHLDLSRPYGRGPKRLERAESS